MTRDEALAELARAVLRTVGRERECGCIVSHSVLYGLTELRLCDRTPGHSGACEHGANPVRVRWSG